MAHLDLSVLGGFLAQLDGQPVDGFASDKARALLAYLAVEGDRPHRWEALAALLWPERSTTSARANLSQVLFTLRSILGDRAWEEGPSLPFLSVSGEAIQLNPASDHHLDVAAFTSPLAGVRRPCPPPGRSLRGLCAAPG